MREPGKLGAAHSLSAQRDVTNSLTEKGGIIFGKEKYEPTLFLVLLSGSIESLPRHDEN